LNYGYGEEWKGSAGWIKSLTRMLLGRMVGKPTIGRRRLQTLHDLIKGDGYAGLKSAGKERKGWRYCGMMTETCSTAED